ncbi:hypothetical protein KA047_00570 [Candidatus Saccharibacteria bacterium]|nr:hypothetical protein [Candidatus Saccharibacteria bacterium]
MFGRKKPQQEGRRQAQPKSGRSTVFSYYAQQNPKTKSPRRTADDTQRKLQPSESISLGQGRAGALRHLPLIITTAVLVIGIIYNTTLSTNAQVITDSVAESQTNFLRDKSVYQSALDELFSESALSRSKLTIDTQELADKLIVMFPELADVTITLPLVGTRPVVHLQATQPALLLVSNDQAYVLDDRGIVLMDAKDLKTTQKLMTVTDESGLEIQKGSAALSREQVAYILSLRVQLSASKLNINKVVLPAQPQQLDVYIDGLSFYGKFLFSTDSRVAAGSFIAAKKQLDRTKQTPRQYIDVRIPGRVFYK